MPTFRQNSIEQNFFDLESKGQKIKFFSRGFRVISSNEASRCYRSTCLKTFEKNLFVLFHLIKIFDVFWIFNA